MNSDMVRSFFLCSTFIEHNRIYSFKFIKTIVIMLSTLLPKRKSLQWFLFCFCFFSRTTKSNNYSIYYCYCISCPNLFFFPLQRVPKHSWFQLCMAELTFIYICGIRINYYWYYLWARKTLIKNSEYNGKLSHAHSNKISPRPSRKLFLDIVVHIISVLFFWKKNQTKQLFGYVNVNTNVNEMVNEVNINDQCMYALWYPLN